MPKKYPFNRSFKIVSDKEYKDVFGKNRKYFDKGLIFFFQKSEVNKIGIIVSRKVSSKAVVRNRVKRRLREAYRLNRQQIQGKVVIVSKNEIVNMTYEEVLQSYTRIVDKINREYVKKNSN